MKTGCPDQGSKLYGFVNFRRLGNISFRVHQEGTDCIAKKINCNIVQHDSDNNFGNIEFCFAHCCDQRPHATCQKSDYQGKDNSWYSRNSSPVQSYHGSCHCPYIKLSFCTNVEKAGTICYCAAKTCKDQRACFYKNFCKSCRCSKDSTEEKTVCFHRACAACKNQNRTCQNCNHKNQKYICNPSCSFFLLHYLASSSEIPPMRRPIFCTVASSLFRIPTIFPPKSTAILSLNAIISSRSADISITPFPAFL